MSGRYGPYVKFGKVNATLPRDADPQSYSLEEAIALIAAKAGKPSARRRLRPRRPLPRKPLQRSRRPRRLREEAAQACGRSLDLSLLQLADEAGEAGS